MCLEMQCDRCQGYFRNFTQIVRQGAETYCVQCDAAIKAGGGDEDVRREAALQLGLRMPRRNAR
jgi:hypothetical protein